MKIQIISDIHLEFYDNSSYFIDIINNPKYKSENIDNGIDKDIDILILAGDIGNPLSNIFDEFIKYVANIYKTVLYITGNHEYYNNSIENIDVILEEKLAKYNNVYFLNNKVKIIEGIKFIGSTLWSNTLGNKYEINDTKKIKKNNKLINSSDIDKMFFNNYKFIKDNVNNNENNNDIKHIIIITHHLPSYKCIDEKYKYSNYTSWFASNCEEIMNMELNTKIKYWFCGHTHSNVNITINSTQIIANPIGYPTFSKNKINFENEKYEPRIIEL
jgi:predicted phosphohydrolase